MVSATRGSPRMRSIPTEDACEGIKAVGRSQSGCLRIQVL